MRRKTADPAKRPTVLSILLLFLGSAAGFAGDSEGVYRQIQKGLQQGWNTWDSRSVLRHVLLPQGLALSISFKQQRWLNESFLGRALIGEKGTDAPRIRPGLHDHDGRYTELQLDWQDLSARIRSAQNGENLVLVVEPRQTGVDPVKMVVSLGMLWNRCGKLGREENRLSAECPGAEISFFVSGPVEEDYYVPLQTPYLVLPVDGPVVVSSGRSYSFLEAQMILQNARKAMEDRCAGYGEGAESLLAIDSALAWNTVYEPRHDRVVSTVGRLWNEEYGGYCLFGWDNFFLAYLSSLSHRHLALANLVEHLESRTDEGFIPNDDRGNGSKSFDRSQPPVGGIMTREVLKRFPERWVLERAYPVLLEWNRWWNRKRRNGALLSYGSHRTDNPFNEPDVATRITAGYESGMDDSPMYQGVPFNSEKGILALQDVGLTSLYIADCLALEEMAVILGRREEAAELSRRARFFRRALEGLWSPQAGYYLNRRSDSGVFSSRRSPTLFYPLLTGLVPRKRIPILIGHLKNPAEFYGEWLLPSISRDDVDFPRQRYWKGAVWPPLNFLVYFGLRRSGQLEMARDLAEKSNRIFLQEWRRKGFVSENYSAINGSGDDDRLSSDRFHTWGALMGIMVFIEQGVLPAPEDRLRPGLFPGRR